MRAWQLQAGASSLDDLKMIELETPSPGPGELLIRIRACSLNFRDQAIIAGIYFGGRIREPLVPLSDGAGEVVSIGQGVTRLQPGDRVAGLFFPQWQDGPAGPRGPALGGPMAPGMLAEYMVLPERGVVRLAESLDFEEAATLPCAGVTAWNALMEGPRPLRPGESVLVLGTGGVSVLALLIAKSAGARVIATSSSHAKLERMRKLGADALINYRETPEWGARAADLAGGGGVDHVVEVGGAGTLAQSVQAVGYGGEVAMMGALMREGDSNVAALMGKAATIRGMLVGSGAMAERLNRAVDAAGWKPMIGKTFSFEEARRAYEYQSSNELFGKVVIRVG